ncbi:hypothetical protein BELL_0550g00020 [Botrytis elliptica]|uniref:Uncharacterized protein n=1 Tax=Botrytis elliptica TaxID=278938 RepID=A0A4Z1JEE9_9HELO|nr:hypothetical protein EAE99_000767 [Botrytis elliptica]TGO71624.1 hypothetical protein BELL_0550g00020 [Botrytis elliptica]
MPPQQSNNMTKQQKINSGIEKLKAARAEAAEKKARDAANRPTKTSSSTAATSVNQAPKPSTSNSISSLPRMKKRPGKSMNEVAEKKAAEEAAAAAKIKRKMAEKEDGEIDSDEEDIVYKGRINNGNQNRKFAPVNNKHNKTIASVPASGHAPSNNKDQKTFSRNEIKNEAKNTTKFKPDIPKLSPRVQKSQDLKRPEEKEQSSFKRKYFDTDSTESEEKFAKPAKKPKTTKAGMNFENVSTKRKHTEEVETSGPVKKQKITEEVKTPVAAPAKRAPIKETKVRNNPTKNLFGFGGSRSTKKPTTPKKGFTQPKSVSKAANENGEKSTENVLKSVSAQVKPKVVASHSESDAPSTEEPLKLRYLPNVSMEELFGEAPNVADEPASDNVSMEELFGEAPSIAAQPIKTPRSAFDSIPPRSAFDKAPVKTKSSRRGPTSASKVEVTKSSASSGSMSTMASNKAAPPSRRKVSPAPNAEVAKPSASIQKALPASTSTSDKVQSSRRGVTPASKDEVTRKITSSIPMSTSSSSGVVQPNRRRAVPAPHFELKKPSVSSKPLSTEIPTKEASRSTSSSITKSTSSPRKVIKKGNGTDVVVPTLVSPVVDKVENTKDIMTDKSEPKKVAEINRSLPASLNIKTKVVPETKINKDVISLDPKAGPSSQAQRPMPQFLGFPGLPAANSDRGSVLNDFFKFENAKETFKTITPNTELFDTAEARDAMELELEREIQIELQNSFHAEQLRSALEDLIDLQAENGESSDQDSSDEDSDEYSSGDESDEEQCEVPQKISKPTVLYKGYNGVLQEEPFYARDRGYETNMSDADEDEGEYYPPHHLNVAYQLAHPYIENSVFNIPITRKPVSREPAVPESVLDELEAEMERCLEAQMAEDAAAEEKSSPPVIPRSAFDNFEAEDDFSSAERHQQDYSEEIASAPVVTSIISQKSSTDFEGDFNDAIFEFNDASGQESRLTDEDPFSLLDASFTFSNAMEMPVEQSSTSEDDDSDSTKKSSDILEEETPRSESPEVSTGPYVSLDGCVGLPPLEDFPDDSEGSDDCDESSHSDVEDSEMSEGDECDIITIDDTTPEESDEDGDLENLDEDEDAELYQKHRVPADLANVEITMKPTELQSLKAKTSWELFDLQKWEQENEVEVYATFDRELLLRNLNVSKKRIAKYMKVVKKYENRTVPKTEAVMEDDSSDDSGDDECSHPINLNLPQVVGIINVPDSPPVVDLDTEVKSNAHPFGPIDW